MASIAHRGAALPTTEVEARHEHLRAFVRFSLSQLRGRNEHHRFEQLCEALSRQRITPNIVTGTGPVSAGGDQGRDFETFAGFATGQVRELGQTLQIQDHETIVFCCTLGQSGIAKKIRADLKSVVASGSKVDVVVYFSESDVPTATRHKLIAEALQQHGVRLHILDGQTITQLLCDRDTFWVAVEFLEIPSHLGPDDAGPDWYAASRSRWLARQLPAQTIGDVIELATCTRHATFNDDVRGDIPMWLDRLSKLLDDANPMLRHRARYETAVATYRGLGDHRPVDDLVRSLLNEAQDSESLADLEDADVLNTYACGAWMFGATDLTPEEIEALGASVQARIEALVGSTPDPDRRCRLFALLGRIRLRPDLRALASHGIRPASAAPAPRLTQSEWEQLLPARPAGQSQKIVVADRDGALAAWSQVVKLLPRAPLFPIVAFAELAAIQAAVLEDDPKWTRIITKIDSTAAALMGRRTTAALARSRSSILQAAGRPFAALRELHRSRADLVAGDTRHEGAAALMDAARLYVDLGLLYAAKHYALAAGAVASADDEPHEMVPASLILAAHCDFLAGNWISFMALLPHAVESHIDLRAAADEPDSWEDVHHLVIDVALIQKVASVAGDPQLADWLKGRLAECGVTGELPDIRVGGLPQAADRESLLEFVHTDIGQQAFADAGSERAIRFTVRGICWQIECDNTFDDVRAAERFAAALQTIIAVFGDEDLVLIESTVNVHVTTVPPRSKARTSGSGLRYLGRGQGDAHSWSLSLTRDAGPRSIDFIAATGEVVSCAAAVLMSMSLLPQESLRARLEAASPRDQLLLAAFPHIRYDRAYAVLPSDDFSETVRQALRPLGRVGFGSPVLSESLAPIRTTGPVFRGETPTERVPGRYGAFEQTLAISLPSLMRDANFIQAVAELRGEGWKDWHLLMALSNLIVNARLASSGDDISDPVVRERVLQIAPEQPDDLQIEASSVSVAELRKYLDVSFAATADAFGLVSDSRFSPREFLNLLATRYEYWTADVDHVDPFVVAESN